MIDQNSEREKMLIALSKKILTHTEVATVLKIVDDYPNELVEDLSLMTALKYCKEQISFDEGDIIMNNLFIGSVKLPPTAWECFLAFDAGEYYREYNDKNIDLPEIYTKPLLEILLKKNKCI